MASVGRRQRIDREIAAFEGIVTPETIGKAKGLLAVGRLIDPSLLCLGRIEIRIAEAVVDRAEAGAGGIAGESELA